MWLPWQYFFRWVESTQIIFRCKSLEKKEPETTAEALKNDLSKMVVVWLCLLKSLVAMVAYRTNLDCLEMSSKNLWAIRTKQHVLKSNSLNLWPPPLEKKTSLVGCIFFYILKCLKGATILTVVELHREWIPSVYSSVESRRMFFFWIFTADCHPTLIEKHAGTATRQLMLPKYLGLVNGIQY